VATEAPRCDRPNLRLELYTRSGPLQAPQVLASHRSGHMGQSQPSCFARCKRLWAPSADGLRVRGHRRLRGAASGMASIRPSPNVRVAGAVGDPVRRSPRWHSALRSCCRGQLSLPNGGSYISKSDRPYEGGAACDGPACRPRKPLDRTAEPGEAPSHLRSSRRSDQNANALQDRGRVDLASDESRSGNVFQDAEWNRWWHPPPVPTRCWCGCGYAPGSTSAGPVVSTAAG
jgi:hypothetical protein